MARDRERILDAYLVASARLGDREALGTLVRRWNGKFIVHAFAPCACPSSGNTKWRQLGIRWDS